MTPTDAGWSRTTRHRPANRLVSRGLVPAAVLAGSLVGASAAAGAAQPKSVVTTAKIAGFGTVLVASHRPLYEMANDPRGHTTCTGACTQVWKPLIVSHMAAHHLGHVSGLGTIHRSNGQLQVAIHGHGLYFYVGDHSMSHAAGQGFANKWFLVHTNGTLDRAGTNNPPPPMTPPSTTPPPTSPPPTSPPPPSPPTTTPPPPPPPPTTTVPPTTTTTTSGGGGGVGF
jgi:predicted lipoprotein with Yx(FWY)xxD motif